MSRTVQKRLERLERVAAPPCVERVHRLIDTHPEFSEKFAALEASGATKADLVIIRRIISPR